jgi:hypothetical protein
VSTRRRVTRFVAAGALAAGAVLPFAATAASAQAQCPTASPSDVTCNPNSGVLSNEVTAPQVEVKGTSVAAPATTSGLPVTGGDIAGLAAAGLVTVGAGFALVKGSRRRTAEH